MVSSWSTDMYECSLIFSFAIILFRVDGGRPSCLATSILFSDGFSALSLRCAVVLLNSELVSEETPFGKRIIKENDDRSNNKKHC
jgi:hypothetical protein